MFQCYIEHPITYQGNVNLSSVGLAAIQGVETWTWGLSGHEDISKHKQLVDITQLLSQGSRVQEGRTNITVLKEVRKTMTRELRYTV